MTSRSVGIRLIPARRLLPSLVLVVTGCTGDNSTWNRVAVTGTVTYQGRPVVEGSISLRPLTSAGPAAGSAIVDGLFEIPADEGPTAGTYLACVTFVVGESPPARRESRPSDLRQPAMKQFRREIQLKDEDNVLDLRFSEFH